MTKEMDQLKTEHTSRGSKLMNFFETTPFDAYFIKQKESFKRNNKLSNTMITKANTHAPTGQHRVLHD